MVVFNERIGKYEIQYGLFDEVEPVDTLNLDANNYDDIPTSPRYISGFV